MIEVTWKFTKRYSEEEFKRQVSESNDVTYLGYLEIEHDLALGLIVTGKQIGRAHV